MNVDNQMTQQFLEESSKYFNIGIPALVFNHARRGQAKRMRTPEGVYTEVILPVTVLSHGEAFTKYYVVHECAHLALNVREHNNEFKETEKKALREVFGIGIRYARVFPQFLYDHETKATLWGLRR